MVHNFLVYQSREHFASKVKIPDFIATYRDAPDQSVL